MEIFERDYFRDKFYRDYGFKFGFVIPCYTKSWKFLFHLPELTELRKGLIFVTAL